MLINHYKNQFLSQKMLQVMTRYISNPDNLKLMMNMLKEKSRNIQFEAFHVFKVLLISPHLFEKDDSIKDNDVFLHTYRCLSQIPINRNQSWTYCSAIRRSL